MPLFSSTASVFRGADMVPPDAGKGCPMGLTDGVLHVSGLGLIFGRTSALGRDRSVLEIWEKQCYIFLRGFAVSRPATDSQAAGG